MSAYDRLASTGQGSRLLAESRLRYRVLAIIDEAMASAELNQVSLANKMGVRKSAVNGVLRGDGNLRVNTLADYLHACGLELELTAVPEGTARKRTRDRKAPLDLVWSQAKAASPVDSSGRLRPDTVRPFRRADDSVATG